MILLKKSHYARNINPDKLKYVYRKNSKKIKTKGRNCELKEKCYEEFMAKISSSRHITQYLKTLKNNIQTNTFNSSGVTDNVFQLLSKYSELNFLIQL